MVRIEHHCEGFYIDIPIAYRALKSYTLVKVN